MHPDLIASHIENQQGAEEHSYRSPNNLIIQAPATIVIVQQGDFNAQQRTDSSSQADHIEPEGVPYRSRAGNATNSPDDLAIELGNDLKDQNITGFCKV